jgi:glycosyl hydrolase family 38/alpha mannosidase-like protein
MNAVTSAAGARDRGPRTEIALRRKLGVPDDAAHVLVFSESSHWDTSWLETSEEYFDRRLRPIFAAIIAALEHDHLRVYCIESVFFLKLFWERHPEHRDRLRGLIESGQLRILTSSLTTPDTLLPHPEAILRDFHLGQCWLRDNGLNVVPRTAYFPDNFGHSPHLPSLMRAVGVDSVAVTRIDGMYFVASDYRKKSDFPLQGSTAALLQKDLRTLDFVWRDDDGAEVLCHWNAYTYFQGDMLAHAGVVRWNGLVAAVSWRTPRHIARRIDGFVRDLLPLTRTPYMLCPIGMDFNDPIAHIRELFGRYNRERFGSTGTWAILAGMDDYFELVDHHRAKLPVLAVDPNPYWMGFYASRPELKQRPTRIARSLLLAEALSSLDERNEELEVALREGWENLVLINHHDTITGTSPDRVCHGEQRDWLNAAEAGASRALALAAGDAALPPAQVEERAASRVRSRGRELCVRTAHHRLTFSKERGGCLTSLVVDGIEQLAGLGLDLLAYADDGGLWRLGHEYLGGRFQVVARASQHPARIDVTESVDGFVIEMASYLAGMPFKRTVTCRHDDPLIEVSVEGHASRRQTVTCRLEVTDAPTTLEMDTIGGTIERPRERVHQPTFWPVPSRVTLQGRAGALHVGFEAPTAVSFSPDHALEWIVARNPMKERAFGILPVLAHPIGGTVDELQTHRSALFATKGRGVSPEMLRHLHFCWLPPAARPLERLVKDLVQWDDRAVTFSAMKRADAGVGVIVRLVRGGHTPRCVRLWLPSKEIWGAFRCDAREENLEPLEIERGQVVVPLAARLTSVRLIVR